jgi:cyclopropane fatty-acyl-phospholipid synthase-like methyltransferase
MNFEKEYFEYCKREKGTDHTVKGLWQRNYAAMLKNVIPDKAKVLDCGAAFGALGSSVADLGHEVTVCDISNYTMNNSPFQNVKKIVSGVTDLKKKIKEKFDFIFCVEVLGHVPNKKSGQCGKNFDAVLNKDGLLLITFEIGEPGKLVSNDPLDDPTHQNLRPEKYWVDQFEKVGLSRRKDLETIIKNTTMYQEYNWNLLIFQK